MVQTFVVTGASRGLGLEFVKQIAARGDIVFACVRNPAGSKDLQSFVDNKQVYAIKIDTTDLDSIKVYKSEPFCCLLVN
jgi:NAD(P)-dependent dehydrogenase (short-subunit alcohol dehydrogenase family)